HAGEWTWPRPPPLAASEVIRRDEHPPAAQERNIDQFAIGGGCAGGEAVQAVLVFERRGEDGLLPEQLACPAVQAEEEAVLGVGQGADDKDAVTPYDGRGVPQTRQFRLPQDIAGGAPIHGHAFFVAGAR